MKTITKLISNSLLSFNPNSKLFSLDLLHEEGTSFLLDLSNDDDVCEFEELKDFIEHKLESFNIENTTSNLEMLWVSDTITFIHTTGMVTEIFDNPVDMLSIDDIKDMHTLLKYVYKKV